MVRRRRGSTMRPILTICALADGCGGTLHCGNCGTGGTCGAGGPNLCGTGTCTAHTCGDVGANCGPISDGCSTTLDCGSCDSDGGFSCGAGGTPNVCAQG